MIGKVNDKFFVEHVLPQRGYDNPQVVIGPNMGVDAAILKAGDVFMAVAEDPVFPGPTTSPEDFAWITVHIGASDVAVMGIKPQFMTYSLLLPPGTPEAYSSRLIRAISDEAAREGIAVVGGHTGYYSAVSIPTIGGITVWGYGRDYISSQGAQPGDKILLTKGAGVEAAALLACELRERLQASGVAEELLDRAAQRWREMSVVKEAGLVTAVGGVHAMHDATEGGVWRGLWEIAQASGTGLLVEQSKIMVPEDIAAVCAAAGLDPYSIISEGTLLMTVSPDKAAEIQQVLAEAEIPSAAIGEIRPASDGCLIVAADGALTELLPPKEDAFWALFFSALTDNIDPAVDSLAEELDQMGRDILPFIAPLLPEIGANLAYAPPEPQAGLSDLAAFPARIVRAGSQAVIPLPAARDVSRYMGNALLQLREHYPKVRCIMNLSGREEILKVLRDGRIEAAYMPETDSGWQTEDQFWQDLKLLSGQYAECPPVIVTPDRINLERVILLPAADLEQLRSRLRQLAQILMQSCS